MKRSEFIKGIAGFLGLAVLPDGVTIRQYRRIYLLQSFVRGFRYYDGPGLLDRMREGGLLELVREQENKYDNDAIALYFDKKKIGFLPREHNEMLSKLMDADVISLQAEITHLKKEAETWENVHVAVYVLKEMNDPLPDSAQYLTILDTPHYRSLKIAKDRIVNIYCDDTLEDNDIMDADEFYNAMVANSRDDGIYDMLHTNFGSGENIRKIITEGRMIVNKKKLLEDLERGDLLNVLKDSVIKLDNYFAEDGYVVANVNRIARLSGRIEKVVNVTDRLGRSFYEIKFM